MNQVFQPQISIVIPIYNDEKGLTQLFSKIEETIEQANIDAEFVLVDDGSGDRSAEIILNKALSDQRYYSITLSRNFGQQMSVSVGLKKARGTKAIMILDSDLQDPPEMIIEYLKYIDKGYDVVYGVRKKRKENFLKIFLFWIYYRIFNSISNYKIPVDSGDFSMLSRRVVDIINEMPEKSRFLRGMRSWIGFKQKGIIYERQERKIGISQYSVSKYLKLASDSFFGFSDIPIKLISRIGLCVVITSFIYVVYLILKKLFWGGTLEGYTSIMTALILFSGVQLISIGIIGEYVHRIFLQSQDRPLYIIDKEIKNLKKEENLS